MDSEDSPRLRVGVSTSRSESDSDSDDSEPIDTPFKRVTPNTSPKSATDQNLSPSVVNRSAYEELGAMATEQDDMATAATSTTMADASLPELHRMIYQGESLVSLHKIISSKPSLLQEKDLDGNLPLHAACKHGTSLEILSLFLSKSTTAIKEKNKHGSYPLHLSCGNPMHNSSFEVIQRLIDGYPEAAGIRSAYGDVPLHRAVTNNASFEVVELLVNSHPAAVTLRDDDQNLPIHLAAGYNASPAILNLLLSKAPTSISEAGQDQKLPIHFALEFKASMESLDCLITFSPAACLEIQTADNMSFLHLLSQHYNPQVSEATLAMVVDKHATRIRPQAMQRSTEGGSLPLHLAISAGASLEYIQALFDIAPSAIYEKNGAASYPLHLACYRSSAGNGSQAADPATASYALIQFLFSSYAEAIFEKDAVGNTPLHLHLASPLASAETIQLFLSYYPDACLEKTRFGDYPIHTAMEARAGAEIIQLLITTAPMTCMERNEQGYLPLHLAMRYNAAAAVVSDLVTIAPGSCLIGDLQQNLALHLAVQYHSPLEVIDLLLEAAPSAASERNHEGATPLHLAAVDGSVVMLHQLIDVAPGACEIQNQDGNTPLHLAAKGASAAIVRLLVDCRPAAGALRNVSGNTPLHRALAYNSSGEVVKVLVDSNQKCCAVSNEDSELPLHIACSYNASPDVLRWVLTARPESGLDLNIDGMSPLHLLLTLNPSSEQIEVFLSNAPTSVLRVGNQEGMSALHLAVTYALSADLLESFLARDESLLKMVDSEGNTALHLAARDSNMIALQVFRAHEKIVREVARYVNLSGNTPLHLAAKDAPAEVISLLLEIDPSTASVKNLSGNTALHRALAYNASIEIASLLLGADPACGYLENEDGETILHIAASYNASESMLHYLLSQDYYANAPDALDSYRRRNADSMTCVHLAAMNQLQASSLQLLLDFDPAIATVLTDAGESPLHVACHTIGVLIDSIEVLIAAAPTTVSQANHRGQLPLHLALEQHQPLSLLQILLKADASTITSIDGQRELPLTIALRVYHREGDDATVISYLLSLTPIESIRSLPLLLTGLEHKVSSAVLTALLDRCPDQAAVGSPLWIALQESAAYEVIASIIHHAPQSVFVKDPVSGQYPLHLSFALQKSIATISLLFDQMSVMPDCLNAVDNQGNTPLHLAAKHYTLSKDINAFLKGFLPMVTTSAKLANAEGYLPLHYFLQHFAYQLVKHHSGDQAIAKELLEIYMEASPESVSVYDPSGMTSLQIAIAAKLPAKLILPLINASPSSCRLKKQGAEGSMESLPLWMAMDYDLIDSELLEALVKVAPEVCAYIDEDSQLQMPFLCYTFLRAAASNTPLPASILTLFLQADPNAGLMQEGRNGNTPLHLAIIAAATSSYWDEEILDLLLRFGQGSSAAMIKNREEYSVIHLAVLYAAPLRIIELLLSYAPASLGEVDKAGNTPLHLFFLSADPSIYLAEDGLRYGEIAAIIGLFLSYYPDACAMKNDVGDLPIHLALQSNLFNSYETIALLVNTFPSSCRVKNIAKLTPFQVACQAATSTVASISNDVLKLLVCYDLPVDQDGQSRGHAYSYTSYFDPGLNTVSTIDEQIAFIHALMRQYSTDLLSRKRLTYLQDSKGQWLLSLVAKPVREVYHDYILFCGRFAFDQPLTCFGHKHDHVFVSGQDYRILEEYSQAYQG
jgi:ankyrin repeat protein